MCNEIGLDIGGTKIAGALYTPDGEKLAEEICSTPQTYESFLDACCGMVETLKKQSEEDCSVGVCLPGAINYETGSINSLNLPFLKNNPFTHDIAKELGRIVPVANDANCMALAEAIEGAGKGYESTLGLILGTGVGSGFIFRGQIVNGPNGFTGEVGHIPMPSYEESDGPWMQCGCGQKGCIENFISGPALARLYTSMTGIEGVEAFLISTKAAANDPDALRVLDRYYEIVAKVMSSVIHTLDPYVIVVSGGLSNLPALYDEIPKRWSKYCIAPRPPKTHFVQAKFGPMAGLRGAALLGRKKDFLQL